MSSTLEIGSSCSDWLSKRFGFLQIVDWSWHRLEAVAACGNRNMIELTKMGVPLDFSFLDIRVGETCQSRCKNSLNLYKGHHLWQGASQHLLLRGGIKTSSQASKLPFCESTTNPPTGSLTGVKCRATSVAKNC